MFLASPSKYSFMPKIEIGQKLSSYNCYNLKLGLDCNLGKTWVDRRRNDQLVKYKNTR